jgi:hypothetical protein
MRVKEVIDMLSYGTNFILLGAKTGKVLHDSSKNRREHAEKFYECLVADSPLYADLVVRKDAHIKSMCDFVRPRIGVWVSGE